MNPDPDRLTEASTPGRAASKGGRIDRAVRALLVGSSALALAGCGGSAGSTPPLQRAVDAASKTLALPGVGYDLTMRGSTIFGALPEPVRGRAAQDLSASYGYEALALPETAGRPAQKLYLDFLRYAFLVLPSPPPAGTLPEGASWISVPLRKEGIHGQDPGRSDRRALARGRPR